MLTSDQVAELLSQQREAESNLESQMEARRNQQMAALRSRISQRRKKRMDDLRENQERDKMEVCKQTHRKNSEILPARSVQIYCCVMKEITVFALNTNENILKEVYTEIKSWS